MPPRRPTLLSSPKAKIQEMAQVDIRSLIAFRISAIITFV